MATAVATERAGRVLFAPQTPRPLRPDAASDPDLYRRWLAVREGWRLTVWPAPRPGPEIEVLLAVDRPGPDLLAASLRSLAAQRGAHFHVSVLVAGDQDADVETALAQGLESLGPGRTTVHAHTAGNHPAHAFAAALEEASCPACVCLEAGDELVPDALAQLSAALVDADVAYADEDRRGDHRLLRTPVLKPAWSPELLTAWCYTGRPVAMRVAPLVAAGGFRELPGGDWEHDVVLRITERTARVAHVPEVLCHRPGAPGVFAAPGGGPAAVTAALERRGEAAAVRPGPLPSTWHVARRPAARPRVSAIVPFRDSTTLLRACADSLASTADDVDLELLLVDNGSTEPETATLVERLAARPGVKVLADDAPFNWAALNNAAARVATGEVLLFLNDDVEARAPGWLGLLAAHALRPEVGVVGARLVYPDGVVQHAGVVIGLTGAAGHVLAGLEGDRPGYLGMTVLARDVSAVTGACMASSRAVFERLGGFDESLWLDFNDIDYCLRARSRGLRVVYEPAAELVHRESVSRGTSGNETTARVFVERWRTYFDSGDPFYNPNLSRRDFSAALDEPGPAFDALGAGGFGEREAS